MVIQVKNEDPLVTYHSRIYLGVPFRAHVINCDRTINNSIGLLPS